MTRYNLDLDLGFLSSEEAQAVLGVLERDKRLKEIENERIRRLREQLGDNSSVLCLEKPRKQQTTGSVQPNQSPRSHNTEQEMVRGNPMEGKDVRRHTNLRARLRSMFSFRFPVKDSPDPEGKGKSHSYNNSVSNIPSLAEPSSKDSTTEARHEEVLTQEGLTKEVLTGEQLTEELLTGKEHSKKVLTEELTKKVLTGEELPKEVLTEDLTKEVLTEKYLTKDVLTEEEINKEVLTGDELPKEVLTKEELTKELFTEELIKEVLTEEELSKVVLTKEEFTKEVLTEEELSKEVLTKEELTKEVLAEEELFKEVLTEEELTPEVPAEEELSKEVLAEEYSDEEPIEDHSESNKVIGHTACSETRKRCTVLLETGRKHESSTGPAHCGISLREDQEGSRVTGPPSAPQSGGLYPVVHEQPPSIPLKEHMQPSDELKMSNPSQSPPLRMNGVIPISPQQPDTSSACLPAGTLSPETGNVPLFRPHKSPKLPLTNLKRSMLQETSGRAATPARHLSLIRPWSVVSPGTFSLLRPSSSNALPASHAEPRAEAADLPSYLPSGLPSPRSVTLRQRISSSHPNLFPDPERSLQQCHSITLPDTTPSHNPLGYRSRLGSSLIFNPLRVSKDTSATKHSSSAKSLDGHLTKAVSMGTAGDNHPPCSSPSKTRWMSSSERINMLAKQHSLVAQVGLSKAISQERNLQKNTYVQSNNQRMFKLDEYYTSVYSGPNLEFNTCSLSSINPGISHRSQSCPHSPPVSSDHMTNLTRSCDCTHSAPPHIKDLITGDREEAIGSEIIHSEMNISKLKRQTSNKGLSEFQNRKNSSGLPAHYATLISERTEELSGCRSNQKVDQILNRLRMTLRSKGIEENSVLFGKKGKTEQSTCKGVSDIGENRTGKRWAPEVNKAPTVLQHNVEGRIQDRGCHRLMSKGTHLDIHDKQRNRISIEKNGNPLRSTEKSSRTNNPHQPNLGCQPKMDSDSTSLSHFGLNTNIKEVNSSSLEKDRRAERKPVDCFKPTQLSHPRNSPITRDSDLTHRHSISVNKIYSNRTTKSRRISTGTMTPTRNLKSLEDVRGSGDQFCPPITLSSPTLPSHLRINESSIFPTANLKPPIMNTMLQVFGSPMVQLPVRSSSLSDCENYDSDTSTDGEYYVNSDDLEEKESKL
ncbi:uncharacterized protein LOC105027702 isoform X2 [Esox lucius]|uniref:uncharacterized protein LOC105027702 isoform X2 n=1 Tax=Esox lucius TaxID=8010 RepID=UPI001476CFB9|nr:uncharacterized protein LOC105027702 isoform X2 [Esox lucius]